VFLDTPHQKCEWDDALGHVSARKVESPIGFTVDGRSQTELETTV
jgi:hypothetical protein